MSGGNSTAGHARPGRYRRYLVLPRRGRARLWFTVGAGLAVVAAVDTGFKKAFLTIIDTHVTTIVSCAFLFLFGTGPVKGFAVTLVIGLFANLFTAVFVSRTIFDWELGMQKRAVTLSI